MDFGSSTDIEFVDSVLFNDSNLLSYYQMEGNSNDSVGSNNGTDTNVVYGTSYGKFNQGVYFNGLGSQIVLPKLPISINNEHSVFLWIYITAWNDQGGALANCYFDSVLQTYTQAGINQYKVSLSCFNIAPVTIVGTTVLRLGRWYHIGWTKLGSTQILYVNGVAENSTNASVLDLYGISTGGIYRRIGARRDVQNNSYRHIGYIDEVVIFNRALSSQEVMDAEPVMPSNLSIENTEEN